MTELPSLLPFAFTVLAYGVCIKLAAWLFRRTQLSWKHALVFGVVLFVVLLAVGTLVRLQPLVSDPVSLSLVDIATGLVAQLTFGGWFLGSRATTAKGTPVTFKSGALLSLITYGLVFSLSIAAVALLPFLARIAGSGA